MLEAQWNITTYDSSVFETYQGPLLVDVRRKEPGDVGAAFGVATLHTDIEFLFLTESAITWKTFYDVTKRCAGGRYCGLWQRMAEEKYGITTSRLPPVPLENVMVGVCAETNEECEEELSYLDEIPQDRYWLHYSGTKSGTLDAWESTYLGSTLRAQFHYIVEPPLNCSPLIEGGG